MAPMCDALPLALSEHDRGHPVLLLLLVNVSVKSHAPGSFLERECRASTPLYKGTRAVVFWKVLKF